MPKVDKITIDNAAESTYSQLVATLGLQGARRCQLQVGRLILAEKVRREQLDGGKHGRKRDKP